MSKYPVRRVPSHPAAARAGGRNNRDLMRQAQALYDEGRLAAVHLEVEGEVVEAAMIGMKRIDDTRLALSNPNNMVLSGILLDLELETATKAKKIVNRLNNPWSI